MNPRIPVLLAPVLLALSASALARTEMPPRDGNPYADYVRARAADDLGQLDLSAASFAAALADDPTDTTLALRTMRQAVAAGDLALAVRTAEGLDARGSLPPDGTALLLADAVADKDWKRAAALADRTEAEKLFGFIAPVARAWIAEQTGRGDPMRLLDAARGSVIAEAYAAEHRALLTVAGDSATAGYAAIEALKLPDSARGARLRVAAASSLARRGKKDLARQLLTGDNPAVVRARDLLAAGRPIPGAIDDAATGIAELFVRMAADINREQAGALALSFARMATLLAPRDSEAWLVTASLLTAGGDDAAALAALDHVPEGDPFTGAVREARLTLLTRAGRADEALATAEAAAKGEDARLGDWARYADLLSGKKRYADAAAAYARALDLAGGASAPADVAWPLLLQQGNAELQGGDWPKARATVARALAVAPNQPAILNFLGYTELEHGGDPAAASAMIAKASQLAPDDAAITDSLGWAWFRRGDLGKAIPLLEQAARASPAETDINEHLGDAYWRAGRQLEARYSWRAALVDAGPDEVRRIQAKVDYGLTGTP